LEKRIYNFLIILTSIIVILTCLILGILFYDFQIRGIEADLSLSSILLMILPVTIGILVINLVFLYFFSSKLTSSILKPLQLATQKIESILSGKEVKYEPIYDELNPFIKAIQFQKLEIEKSIMKLKEAEKYRREFTANVSHELKTPLTSINGYAEMIAMGITNEEDVVKFAKIIGEEGNKLLGLIDSIINLSKLDGESVTKAKETFEVVDLLEIASNIVGSLEHGARERDIHLNILGDSTFIRGNRRMLEDLISNLIDNAIKYNRPQGVVDINIGNTERNTTISVKDTGIGIPDEDIDRVFDRFYRVDKSRSKSINGTGIGLSIVKHIVEYHNGKITLSSELGKGTEIKISLPR